MKQIGEFLNKYVTLEEKLNLLLENKSQSRLISLYKNSLPTELSKEVIEIIYIRNELVFNNTFKIEKEYLDKCIDLVDKHLKYIKQNEKETKLKLNEALINENHKKL